MSQQGPGGYGGGGPYGPPGGGGYGGPPPGGGYGGPPPPGGYGPPGAPPGGYGGPPGYGPPGGYGPSGAPPNYGQPQYGAAPPGGPPSPNKSPLIWAGVGCAVLILLGAVGGVFALIAARKKANDVEQQIELAVALGASAFNGQAPPTPACANAIACCKLTIAKTAGANAAAVEQACTGLGLLSDAACAQQYEGQKRAATALGLTCP